LSYFAPSKSERDTKSHNGTATEPRLDAVAAGKSSQEVVSTLGPGMQITGNIICTGAVQIFGRVIGDIHATRLVICKGGHVEGKIVAQEMVVDGVFKGTIHGNNVKLQATAVVDGEIFNKSLTIEQNAQFEGVARRLERAVDAPSSAQAKAGTPAMAPAAEVIPISGAAGHTYKPN
jgi:cytoskeletal protein CcmA (bactofilin family)